jgi:drug/metabolite transporter (DMT)-like permease
VLWGVFSAFLFALRNVLQRHYFTHYPAPQTLFYQSLVVAVMVLPFLSGEPAELPSGQWGLLLLLGVVFTALPHALFANGLIHFKAKTASLISCLQVVYGTVFAAVLLAEVPDWRTLLGGALIVSAAAYESVRANR